MNTFFLKSFCFIFVLFLSFSVFSQEKDPREVFTKGRIVKAIIVNGDTVPLVDLAEVKITGDRIFISKKQAEQYDRLKRNVKKVYPYAIIASAKLKEYNLKLATLPEYQRKGYMKKAEAELKTQFEEDLKKLTMTQGRILIKLIDRETGQTSYELVQDLRGSFSAFMWQGLARIFGSNLKSEYNGKADDKEIERIILLIEGGEI